MPLKILYLLTCRVLGVAVLVFRGDRVQAAELLVLVDNLYAKLGAHRRAQAVTGARDLGLLAPSTRSAR